MAMRSAKWARVIDKWDSKFFSFVVHCMHCTFVSLVGPSTTPQYITSMSLSGSSLKDRTYAISNLVITIIFSCNWLLIANLPLRPSSKWTKKHFDKFKYTRTLRHEPYFDEPRIYRSLVSNKTDCIKMTHILCTSKSQSKTTSWLSLTKVRLCVYMLPNTYNPLNAIGVNRMLLYRHSRKQEFEY